MTTTAPVEDTAHDSAQPDGPEVVEQDLLVEDVSIDGMCGVY
jgi:mycofactocin precursor